MGTISKGFSLLLVVIMAVSSLMMVESAFAQSIPKPSVPEFTIEIVSSPYDVPPTTTTTIDPYTGKETVTTHPGYHVENKTTQIRINNQPFTPYEIQGKDHNWTINLYYNIRLKGHFSQNWGYYRLYNGSSDGNLVQDYDSKYTVIFIDSYLPSEGKMDFQIEALTGYEHGVVSFVPGAPGTSRVITGESSGWSNIQTITIPSTSTSPPPNPTPTPTIPELLPWTISLLLSLMMLASAGLLVYHKKHKHN
jgi:hypothetical protein